LHSRVFALAVLAKFALAVLSKFALAVLAKFALAVLAKFARAVLAKFALAVLAKSTSLKLKHFIENSSTSSNMQGLQDTFMHFGVPRGIQADGLPRVLQNGGGRKGSIFSLTHEISSQLVHPYVPSAHEKLSIMMNFAEQHSVAIQHSVATRGGGGAVFFAIYGAKVIKIKNLSVV